MKWKEGSVEITVEQRDALEEVKDIVHYATVVIYRYTAMVWN